MLCNSVFPDIKKHIGKEYNIIPWIKWQQLMQQGFSPWESSDFPLQWLYIPIQGLLYQRDPEFRQENSNREVLTVMLIFYCLLLFPHP